jgi:predicted TIM-barrel fold metal-dependent hydrolase
MRLAWVAVLVCATARVCPGAQTGSADSQASYYGASDFTQVEKIDAHVHLHGPAERFMRQAIEDGFRLLEINVDYPDFPPVEQQQRDAVSLRQRYPDRVAFAAAFTTEGFGTSAWPDSEIAHLEQARLQGAVGVKIWKNIGMSFKDAAGHYVMPDDARLDPVFSYLERNHIVLLGHMAEPLNCWLPMDRMTIRGDREYFARHPQYYMYRHPQMPSHDQILAARDRMLAAHPQLTFDAVHLASLEWDVDRVAAFLDRFPHASVDLAARLVHLEHQAVKGPAKVRRFLVRYQDRILYGSDDAYGPRDDDPVAVAEVHAGWLEDWRFLTTQDAMTSTDFDGHFTGMHLPREIVDKLYRVNAQRLFPQAWPTPQSPPP